MDKLIMTVPNTEPFGYKVVPMNTGDLEVFLRGSAQVADRAAAETDETIRQIIPYILVMGGAEDMGIRLLTAVRKSGGNEQRLYGGITLGFGGHVKWDGVSDPMLAFNEAVISELHEELGLAVEDYGKPEVYGLIVDDTDAVGSVHLGVLMGVSLTDPYKWTQVRSNEPDKLKAFWTNLAYAGSLEPRMEGWARLTYQFLVFETERQMAQAQQQQFMEQMSNGQPIDNSMV